MRVNILVEKFKREKEKRRGEKKKPKIMLPSKEALLNQS